MKHTRSYPAAQAATEDAAHEQRSALRHPIDVHITLRDSQSRLLICRVVDLSISGVQVRLDRSSALLIEQSLAEIDLRQPNATLTMQISLRCLQVNGTHRCVHADASLVYLREVGSDEYRVGLHFDAPLQVEDLTLCTERMAQVVNSESAMGIDLQDWELLHQA